jgi:hypothetical protein
MCLVLARIQPIVATTRSIGMGQLFTDFYSRLPKTIPKNNTDIANFDILIYVNQSTFLLITTLWRRSNT